MERITLFVLTTSCMVVFSPFARAQQHKLVHAGNGTFGYRDTPIQPFGYGRCDSWL